MWPMKIRTDFKGHCFLYLTDVKQSKSNKDFVNSPISDQIQELIHQSKGDSALLADFTTNVSLLE